MRLFTGLIAIGFSLMLAGGVRAADIDKDKIIGQWKIAKGDEAPPGTLIEFSKDGKVIIHIDLNGKLVSMPVGTYKIEGDKITLIASKGGKDDIEVNTIKSLTADKLVLVDPKNKETEFERAKAKN